MTGYCCSVFNAIRRGPGSRHGDASIGTLTHELFRLSRYLHSKLKASEVLRRRRGFTKRDHVMPRLGTTCTYSALCTVANICGVTCPPAVMRKMECEFPIVETDVMQVETTSGRVKRSNQSLGEFL